MAKEIKVKSADTNGYDKTIQFQVLMCNDPRGNNNKFYCIELQHNETTNSYRLFTHYGRLGKTQVFGIREMFSIYEAEKEMGNIIKKKTKGKKMDGYIERYVQVETFAPTVGSNNIRNKTQPTIIKDELSTELIKQEYTDLDSTVSDFINQICEENIHKITSTMDIFLTSTWSSNIITYRKS